MKKKSKRKGGIVGLCKTRTCMNMYERSSKSFSLNGSKLKTPKWVDIKNKRWVYSGLRLLNGGVGLKFLHAGSQEK